MGLFDEIGKKIAKSSQDTVKKARSLAETTRINSQIAEEQRALTAFYAQIGEKYYTLHKDAPDGEFAQFCDRITAGLARVAELQTEIQKLKNTRLCPNCGAACPANVQFCAACGTQLPPIEQPEQESRQNGDGQSDQAPPQTEDGQSDQTPKQTGDGQSDQPPEQEQTVETEHE